MFNQITLPSGTVFNIPIFGKASEDSIEIMTRSGGVILDIAGSSGGGQIAYQSLSDSDIIALGNILLNANCTTLDKNYNINVGHAVAHICWAYDASIDDYKLCFPLTHVPNSPIMIVNYGFYGNGSGSSFHYYNGHNSSMTSPQYPYTDFYDGVHSGVYVQPTINIRPGYLYSIDFGVKGDYINFAPVASAKLTSTVINANIAAYKESHPDENIETNTVIENPYGIITSAPGGGDGDTTIDPDEIEKASIPALPTLSAVDAGMITMYYATNGQLKSLASYLWANIYDLETNFVKLFASPMDCIIGLGIVPVIPSLGSASTVKFGNINTNVSMTKLASQFIDKDCGSVSVPKWIGSFLDYAPYVKLSLYLPYIGYRELDPNDVVGDTIHVVYHIDCLTGGCCAFVETGKKGLLYSFNGSCIANVPLTAVNFSGAIQNAVSAVGAGLTTVAGIATGAAPLTAMGVTSMLSSAANTAVNSKPTVQRSGSMGGAAGLMGYQKPMLIIERPRMCVPNDLNHFVGNTLYVTKKLSTVQGFTQIDMINLDGVPCTTAERKELESILHEGVYL